MRLRVKQNRYGSELEVLVRSNSDLHLSPTKFDIAASAMSRDLGGEVSLAELTEVSNFQKICVRVKIMAVKESETVRNALVKQDCIVADASASCKLVLWEEHINCFEEGVSYKLSGLIVRTYNGKKYLSIPKDSSFDFEVIDDVGATEEKGVEEEGKMKGVVVIGVKYFDACYSCKGKVVLSGGVGECGRCGMMQRAEKCKTAITVKMNIEADGYVKCVSAFSPIVEQICEGDVSKRALLSCQDFDVVINEKNVIISVSR